MFEVLVRTHKGTNYATWILGMAAIGVLTIHYGGLGLREIFPQGTLGSRALNNLVDFGGQGPTIFFVASGYVLQKYIGNEVRTWKLFLTRFLRLTPAYTLVLWIAAALNDGLRYFSLEMFIKKLFFGHLLRRCLFIQSNWHWLLRCGGILAYGISAHC